MTIATVAVGAAISTPLVFSAIAGLAIYLLVLGGAVAINFVRRARWRNSEREFVDL